MGIRPHFFILAAALVLLLAACGGSAGSTATAPAASTAATAPTQAVATPTAALATASAPTPAASNPTATKPPVASTSPIPANPATATPPPTDQAEPPDYRDDRSTPIAVLESLYNAINSRQYARAYSYWEESDSLPSFETFAQGYADTAHVDLTTGTAQPGAAAGNLYYDVPVILHVTRAGGSPQIFAGCYTLHLAQPALQAAPPYHPMAISRGDLQQVQTDADATAIFDKGCQPGG